MSSKNFEDIISILNGYKAIMSYYDYMDILNSLIKLKEGYVNEEAIREYKNAYLAEVSKNRALVKIIEKDEDQIVELYEKYKQEQTRNKIKNEKNIFKKIKMKFF